MSPIFSKMKRFRFETTKMKKARKLARTENPKFIHIVKLNGCCQFCGRKSQDALQFHHLGRKRGNVSKLSHDGYPLDIIINEMNKCVLLCDKCHKNVHTAQRVFKKKYEFKRLVINIRRKKYERYVGESRWNLRNILASLTNIKYRTLNIGLEFIQNLGMQFTY